jgi:hypothetical protein
MFASISYSFFISRESSFLGSPLFYIVDTSGSHHLFEIISHTMVDANPYILFDSTNLSQVDGFLKYESREACQDNETLWSTFMVMSSPRSFGFSSWMNKFININTLSPNTPHTNSIHDFYLICYFPLNPLHQVYVSHDRFYDRIEAWFKGSYSDNFPMNDHYDIFNMVDRVYQV